VVLTWQFATLEAATGLTAEAEQLGELEEELRCGERLQHVAFVREGRWLFRSWWTQQSAFLRLRRRGRIGTSSLETFAASNHC
jgi:hypothetical protein